MSVRYRRYLQSRHWLRRRQAFAATHRPLCKCGETRNLQLHHRTYDRLGAERDEDLMWLCQSCHTLVEQLVDEGMLDRACKGFFSAQRAQKPPERPKVTRAEVLGSLDKFSHRAREWPPLK